MAITSKYFILPSTGADFIDFELNYGTLTLAGQDISFIGSTRVNAIFVHPGITIDFTGSGSGSDKIYFEGSMATYTSAFIGGSYIRLTGNSQTVTLAADELASDRLIFADGTVTAWALFNHLKDPVNNPSAPVPSGETSVNPSAPAQSGSTLNASVKAYSLNSAGETFAMTQHGMALTVIGSTGVDKVYIPDGGNVDATGLGGGRDQIYLRGNWGDYTKSFTGSSYIKFTRMVNDDLSESVTVAFDALNNNDRLYFADGSVLTNDVATTLKNNLAAPISSVAGYRADLFTPGLDSTPPALTVAPVGDGNLSAAEATGSSGVVSVTTEAGAQVVVVLTGTSTNTVTKYLTGTGNAQAVVLDPDDLVTLGNGAVTVTTHSTDAARNQATVNTGGFTLDATAPTTTIATLAFSADSAANGGSNQDFNTRIATQDISGTLSSNLAAGETVSVSLDNGAHWSTATASVGSNTWSLVGQALSGSNTLLVKVIDAAGNDGPVLSQAYVLDNGNPTTSIATVAFSADTAANNGSNNDLVTRTAAQDLSGTLSTNLAAGETVYVSLNNGSTWIAANATTGQNTWTLAGQTLTGSNTLKVKISDAAGNDGPVLSQAYVLDTTAPVALTVVVPEAGIYGAGDNPDNLTFSVQFDEAVTIDAQNPPTLSLTIGANTRTATYDSSSSADTLVFKYRVTNTDKSDHDDDGKHVLSVTGFNGTVTDLAGNAISLPLTLNNIGSTAAVVVDGGTSGSGIDGYLSGVTIYADNNTNGMLDAGDSVAITNATGGFKLYGASGPLVMYGGTDISTGLDFNVQYEAPAGYSVINPVSSLIRAVQENPGGTPLTNDAAYTVVREAIFGATGGPSLTAIRSYDPFRVATDSASTQEQIADAIAYQRVAAALATLVEITSEAMSALDLLKDQRGHSIDVFDALAARLADAGHVDGSLWTELQDGATNGFIETLIETLTAGFAPPPTQDQIDAIVGLIDTAITTIEAAGNAGDSAIQQLTDITKVQLVAQGQAAQDLADYLDGTKGSFDNSDFQNDVNNADVGVVVPVQFSIAADAGNAAVLEGQSGETPTLTFTVTRSNNVDVAATVNYQVSGGTELTGADFASGLIPSGELTFAAGETSQTITIQLAGNDLRQNDRPFMVTLVDPTGTASIPTPNAFANINDDDPFTPVVYLNGTADVAAGQATTITTVVDYYDPTATLTVNVTTSNATASAASTSGNLAQVNAWLAALTLNGTSGTTQGTLDISVSVDGRTGSASSLLTIHNAPTQDLPASLAVTAGQAAAVAGVGVHDVDGDNLTVDLTATGGSLALGDSSNVAVVAIGSGLQLTGSVADLNAALLTLSYTGAPGQSNGVITLASNDGDALTSDPSGSINVTIAAAAPTLTLPGSAAPVTIGVPSTVTGISVADSDSPLLSVTLAAGNGTLQAIASGSAVVAGNSSATLTVSGTSADINTTLAGLRYTATGAGPTLAVSVNDNDATTTDPTNMAVSLTVVENTAPAAGGDLTDGNVTEDTPTTLHLSGFTLTDVDGTAPSAVRILSVTGGTLLDAGGNTIALGTTGSVLALNAGALDLQFTPDSNRDSAASISYVVVDPLVGTLNSAPSTITVPITPVNDAPVVSPASGSITYAENGTGMKVASTLTIADVDSPQMSGATVSITNYQAGDVLDASGLPAGITANYDTGTGVLTLSGTATRSDYEAALRLVKFSNTSDTPDTTPRAISIVVQDVAVSGTQASSIAAARTVNVVAVNDAPVIADMPATPLAYAENATAAAIAPDLVVTDADSANLARAIIAITSGYRSAEDVLSASGLPAGITATFDSTSGRLTLSGVATVADYQAALRTVAYSNSSDNPTTHQRTVKLVAADSPDLVASALASRAITITPNADKPVVDLNGLLADGSNNAVTFVHALYPNGIAIAPNAQLSDVDSTQLSKLTVTLTDAQAGDSLSLSASALAVATSSGITIDTSVVNQITLTGNAALTSYTNLLKGVLFKSDTAGVEADRLINVVATDITGATLVSDTATATVTESTSPFAAIATGSKTLTLTGNPGSSSASVNLPAMTVSTPAGNVAVAGDPIFTAVNVNAGNATGVNVTVIGNTVNNIITGSAGNDILLGGGGTDDISGGAGNDRITWQAGSTLDGGEGNDTLVVTGNFDLSAPGATLSGFEVIDASGAATGVSLTGDASVQTLVGGNFNDTLKGGAGDTLTGGLGKDVFDVSEAGTATNSAVTITDLALGDSIKLGAAPTGWNVQVIGGFNFLVFDVSGTNHYVNLGTTLPSDWHGWSLSGDTLSVVKVPTQTVAITAMTRDSGASATDFVTNDGAARVVNGTLSAALGANEVVQVSFDNGATWSTANTTGLAWSASDSGSHSANWTIQARVANTEANVHGTAASRVVTFDNSVGTLGLALANDTGSNASDHITSNAAITTTGQEDGATVQYSSNGTVWGSSIPAPVQGSNTIHARQTDAAGNISTPASLTFTYDTQAPAAPTGLALAAGSDSGLAGDRRTNDTTPTINGTAEAGSQVTLREGNTVLGTATADASTGAWSITTGELGSGQHLFSATTRDAAGNVSSPASLVINIDTSAPAAPGFTGYTNDTGIQGDGITSDNRPVLSGTAEANATVNLSITQNSAPFTTATVTANAQGVWTLQPPVALADGVYTISATATDAAGNTGPASTSPSVTIDHTAPTVTATLLEATDNVAPDGSVTEATVIPSGGTSNDSSLTLHGSLSGDLGNGEVVAVYDGATRLGTADIKATDWTFNTSGLVNSLHSFSVRVEDAAGNQSAASTAYLVTIDTAVPTATVAITSVADDVALITGNIASAGLTNDQQPTLSGSITGTLAAGEQVVLFDGAQRLGNATVSGDGTTWTFTPSAALGQGSHSFTARVENAGGSAGTTSPAHIVIVDSEAPAAPVVTPADATPVSSGGGLFINNNQINVSGLETNATWQYTVDGGETWTNGSGSSFTLADGTYTSVVQVRQIDQAGNVGTPGVNAGDSLTVDTRVDAPTLALFADTGASDSDRLTSNGRVVVSGLEPGAAWQFSDDGGNQWFDGPESNSLTPGSEGNKSFIVRQTDLAGNASAHSSLFSFTLDTSEPLFQSATVSGTTLVLNYSEALDASHPPVLGDFSVKVGETTREVTDLVVSGTSVTLTLASAVTGSDTVTITYFDQNTFDNAAIQDMAGVDAGGLGQIGGAGQPVTNTSGDAAGPTPTNATIDGNLLTISFNEALDPAHLPSTSYMQVMVSGSGNISPRNIIGTQISGSNLLITLGTPVVSGDEVTITYKDPTTGDDVFAIQDVAGNDTASVNSVPVTNVTGTNTSLPNLVAASFSETANATVTLTFNEPMQASQIGNLMLFKNGEGSNILTGVQGISGGAVTFTTSATLTANDHVVLSYFGGGDLRDMSGNYISQITVVIGGSGANSVDLENNINWSQFTNSITVRGNGGADHLIGSGNNDYIYAGGGTDIVNGGWGRDHLYLNETVRASDTVMIGTDGGTSSGSQPFYFDRVFGFDTTSAVEGTGNTNDVLNMASNTIAAATTGFVDGTDAGNIRSHSIGAGGLLTFGSADSGTPVLINEANLSDATWYLVNNLTNPGYTVAFSFDFDNNGHADSLFVFQDGGGEDIDNDSLILLAGVNGVRLGTVAGQNVVRLVDTTGPEINGGNMGGDALTFFYNEDILASGPAGEGFTALLNGTGTNVITEGSIAGNALTLLTSTQVHDTDYLLVSYDAHTGAIYDGSGNPADSDQPGFALGGTGNNTIDLSLLPGFENYGIHDLGGNDTLIGNAGTNEMEGGDGDDVMDGGDGNDELSGGTGADNLDGGAGADEFRFTQGDSTPVAYNAAAGTYTFTGGADVITGGFDVLATNNDSRSGDSIHLRSGMPGNGVSAMGTWNLNTFVPSTPSDGLAADQQYFLQRGNYSAGVFTNNVNGTDTLVVYDGNNLTGAVSQTALVIQGVNPTQLTATEWGDIYLSTNHAPVINSNGGVETAGIGINENTTFVITMAATDADGSPFYWSINGGADAAKFSIDTISGALTFHMAPDFEAPGDVGGNNIYDVIVQVSDGNLSDTQAIAVSIADVNEDAPPATLILGSGSTSLALINPVVLDGKVYYYVDRSGDGTNAGDDYFYHFEVDNLFNGGDDTVDTQPSGAVAGVDDARTYIAGDYTVVLPTQAELHALFAVEGSPVGWINGLYLSSTLESPGYHYRENTNGGAGLAADTAGNSLAVQILFSGSGVDITAPVFQSASIQGATLTLAYNEALDSAHLPLSTAFNVLVNGVAATVNSVAASGSSLLLTLAAAVDSDDAVTFSYTDAAGDDTLTIQDFAGNDALSLSPTLVTNLTCYYIPSASLTETADSALATISMVKFSGADDADGYITTPPTAPNASAAETSFLAAVTTLGKDLRLYDFEDAASGNFAGSATVATYVPTSGMTVSGQTGDISLGNAQGVLALDSYLATHLFCIGSSMGSPTAGNDPGIATNEGNDADRGYNVTTSGNQYLEVLPGDTSNGGVVLDFVDDKVTGFGLTLMGRQETKRDVYADIYLSNGDVVRQLTATHPYDQGGEQFLGYLHVPLAAVNYTIDKVVFYEPYAAGDTADERDIFALDDIYIVVPEGEGNLEPDTTAPTFNGAMVNGSTLVMVYNEVLDGTHPPLLDAFTVMVGAATRAVSNVTVSGSNVTLTLASAVLQGEDVTISYSDPTTGNDSSAIQDAAGNDAASLSPTLAHNMTTSDTTAPYPVGASFVAGSNIYTAVFSEAMQLGSGSAPTLLLNGTTPITVTANPVVTGNSISVTTNTTFQDGDYVMASCASNSIFQDLAGNSVVPGTRFVGGAGNNIIDAANLSISQWPVAMFGNAGNDALSGTANNDLLIGGMGADTLNGGSGADVFEFQQGDSPVVVFNDANSNGVLEDGESYSFNGGIADVIVGSGFTETGESGDRIELLSGIPGQSLTVMAQDLLNHNGLVTDQAYSQVRGDYSAGIFTANSVSGADILAVYDGDSSGGVSQTAIVLQGFNYANLMTDGHGNAWLAPQSGTTLAISSNTMNGQVYEGNSGTTPVTFQITRSGDTSGNTSVDWSVVTGSGSTVDASDFVGNTYAQGSVTFAAGEMVKTLTVEVAGDTAVEANEIFGVRLSNPTGATLSSPETQVVIVNDDSSGGGDTTAPYSTSASFSEITGTWTLNDPDFVNLILLADGRFMYMEAGGGDEPNGLEGGTYAYNTSTSTITFNVTSDFNSDGGINPGLHNVALPVSLANGQMSITFAPNEIGVFDRQPATTSGIAGTWMMPTSASESFSMLVLYADGRFTYGEAAGEAPNGMESGTYNFNAGALTFNVTFDNNGDGGIRNGVGSEVIPASVGNNNLILSGGDGPLTLTRVYPGTVNVGYSESIQMDNASGFLMSLNPNQDNGWNGVYLPVDNFSFSSSALALQSATTLAATDVLRLRYDSGPGTLRDLVGNEAASGEIWIGGSGASVIDLDNYGSNLPLTLRGNGGADRLVGTNGNDVLIDGGGADSLSGSRGADIIRLVENGTSIAYFRDVVRVELGESPSSGAPYSNAVGTDIDIVMGSATSPAGTGFDITSSNAAKHDVLDLPSNNIAGTRSLATGTVDGNSESSHYTGTIAQHGIATGGIVSFATAAGTAILIDGSNAGDAINYLDLNITDLGTVAFEMDTDNDGTPDALIVYQDAGHSALLNMDLPDLALVLAGITGATLGTAPGMNVVQIQDTQAPEPVAEVLTSDGVRFNFAEIALVPDDIGALAMTLQKNGTGTAFTPTSVDGNGSTDLTLHFAGLSLAPSDWAMLAYSASSVANGVRDAAGNTLMSDDTSGSFTSAWGGSGNNTIDLSAMTGVDDLQGHGGDDTLIGTSGNNWLVGGTGADTLTGGAGRDEFEFDQGDSPAVTARNLGSDGVLNNGDTFSFANGVDRITDLVGGESLGLNKPLSDLLGNSGAPSYMGATPANGLVTDQGYFATQGNFTGGVFTVNDTGTDTLLVWDGDATNGVSQTGLVLSGVQVTQLQLWGSWINVMETSGFSNADDTYQLPTAPVIGQTVDVLGGTDTLLMPFYPEWIMPQGPGLHFGDVLVPSSLTPSDIIYTLNDNSGTSYHLSGMHDLLSAQPVVDYDLTLSNFEHLRFDDGMDVLDINIDQDIGMFDGTHAVAGVLNGNTLAASFLFASYDATDAGVTQVIGGAALADTAGFNFAGIEELQMSKDESGATPVWRFTDNTNEVFSITQVGEDWAFDYASTGAGVDVTLRNIEYAAILNSADDMLLRLSFVNAQPQVIL